MSRLIALLGPAGPTWVAELQRAWERGDAVLPVDPRLPTPAKDRLLDAMAPSQLAEISPTGHVLHHRRSNGRPMEAGDALVVATSGTTGHPKGVILTHDAVAASAYATTQRLGVDPHRHGWLACLPLSHIGGLSVVTRALVTGTALTVLPHFDPYEIANAVTYGATHVSLVATALARLDPDLFERIILGGAAPPPDRPTNTVVTYGMTETGSGVVYDGLTLDGVDVRVVEGEIQLRGPMLLRAYRDGTDPKNADGWMPTGDLGAIDETSGMVSVHGRAGELIITGGENVWPTPVEQVLLTHPAVAEVAVIGRQDREWGQRVTALVVPEECREWPSLDELRDHVKEQLPAFAAPREVEFVETLPRTALGKIVRSELR